MCGTEQKRAVPYSARRLRGSIADAWNKHEKKSAETVDWLLPIGRLCARRLILYIPGYVPETKMVTALAANM